MIQFDNVSKSFPSGSLFSGVTLSIKKGVRAGLVGKNGSGKTTLLRMMLGLDSPDSGKIEKEKNLTIGYLQQEIIVGSEKSILEEVLASFPEIDGLDEQIFSLSNQLAKSPDNDDIAEELGVLQFKFESMGGWDLEKKAKKILGGLGFVEWQFKEPMRKLSGGWRMRVALSKILMQDPDVLFLDEPTNHLDLEATIWLEKFLASWNGGMVLISHDRTFLDRSINHIIEIDLRRIKLFKGTYSDFIKSKKIEMDLYLNAYKNQQREIKETERFIERFRYKNTKATQVQSRIKKLEKLEILEEPSEDNSSIRLKIPQPSRSPLRIVSCKDVGKSYGDVEVFNDLKFVVERENKIGLVGINGAGKSTLLKMLAGVEKPSNGTFEYGQNIKVSYYAQHQLETLEEKDTVYESIEKFALGMTETQIRTYLGGFLFSGEEIEKKVKVLSGGEKARLAFGRMLLDPSNLLLLDEPTNHLDMLSRSIVEDAMASFEGSIVCISHDRHFLNKITNITCEVGNGGVITYQGNYEYYEWKKEQQQNEDATLVKPATDKKKDYQLRKQSKNRIAWINKRFKQIEKEIKDIELLLHDVKNKSNAHFLNELMEKISKLENEYLEYIEELDKLSLL
tara:strand:+ start:1554 stop:3416 length:1863 start_codon:yes stop_codon:yes gene_type:complete